MELKEKITVEEVNGKAFKIRMVEASEHGNAALTHYLHNHKNGVSRFYKKEALNHIKRALEYKFPEDNITSKAAEEALQYMIFDFQKEIPFPAPTKPKFKFIDLFAGIGGFRLAMQNLGGKCVYTSEWDEQAKKTYQANFGEVPFGDITKEETKKFIPDNFDVLCAGFPCQAFSIAGRRGGFEDTRGTLFFDVAEIIKRKKPKAIFLENVKGLRNHDKGKTLKTILNVLREDLGYYVPEPKILNAKDFGVPQNRERIFIVGFRSDMGIEGFEYPLPPKQPVSFEEVKEKNVVSVKYYLSDTYLNTLIKHKQRHADKGNGFGYQIIEDDSTANAVVCGGMGRERNLVYDDRLEDFTPVTHIKGEVNRQGIRKMTPREWARLQGFPDNFLIPVADASAYKQFGNSVAVPAIQATGNQVVEKILKTRKSKKTKTLETKDKMMLKGNKGEWSEIYTLFKLLGDKQLFLGNKDIEKLEGLVYPIIKILRTENNGDFEYSIQDELILISGNEEILKIPIEAFKTKTLFLLNAIRENREGTFPIPEIEEFMHSINCMSLKASSSAKTDITIVVHDQRTNQQPTLGFSIKSQLGSPSTLLNAGKTTNFIFKIKGVDLAKEQIENINSISSRSKIMDRIVQVQNANGTFEFVKTERQIFSNNLVLIDSLLPQILSQIVFDFYSSEYSHLTDLVNQISEKNPLNFDVENEHKFYEYKIKRFLTDVALGMMPSKVWSGKYDATGGYLIVKENGDVLCYHIYNRNEFEDYLINNTKLDTASSSRHGFGEIYQENNLLYFKLNLQIRFTK